MPDLRRFIDDDNTSLEYRVGRPRPRDNTLDVRPLLRDRFHTLIFNNSYQMLLRDRSLFSSENDISYQIKLTQGETKSEAGFGEEPLRQGLSGCQ